LRQVTIDASRCTPVASDADEDVLDDAHLYLRLPVKDKKGNLRIVDGQCAICILEYEPDDKIVWSGLQCRHAFHADCVLTWLAKGKKRCPTCRQWFVPESESRAEDEKREHLERLQAIASSSEATNETQDDSQSHLENSSTAVVLGTSEDDQLLHVSPLPIDLDTECGNASDVVPFNEMP
jgi:Ring finger domain